MRSLYGALLALLILPTTLVAQTVVVGPVSTANRAAWEALNVASPTQAQTFEPRFRVDGSPTPIVLPGVTCTASTPPIANQATCTANLSPALVSLLNVTGSHTVVLRLFDAATALESVDSVPFALKSGPSVPTGARILP